MNPKLLFSLAVCAVLALPTMAMASGTGHEHSGSADASADGADESSHARFWFGHPGAVADATRTIKVAAMDIRFEPAAITVKVGETVRFEVVNQGQLEHEFVLADDVAQTEHDKEMQEMAVKMPGMKMHHTDPNAIAIKPGESKMLVWTFTKGGKLQYGCHVPGHFAAGMVGQLTVN